MKTLFITYQDISSDGRTKALIENLKRLGEVFVLCPSSNRLSTDSMKDVFSVDSNSYMEFVKKSVGYIRKNFQKGDFNCLFVDNRRATTIGLKANKLLSPQKLIYDARELYLSKEMRDLKGKIGCFYEKKIIEKADIVICANEERKEIMNKVFKTKEDILVFDNFRKLDYSKDVNLDEIKTKYEEILKDESFRIISTAGCDISRLTDKLVLGMKNLPFKASLLLVGAKEGEDKEKLEKIIEENQMKNITFIPRVNQDELKYLISISHVGVSTYHQENMNNLYCSSGKVYEYIYEGKPILISTNPTLKNLVDKYDIGAYNDDLGVAIEEIYRQYDKFSSNVQKVIEEKIVENNYNLFVERLKNKLGGVYVYK